MKRVKTMRNEKFPDKYLSVKKFVVANDNVQQLL